MTNDQQFYLSTNQIGQSKMQLETASGLREVYAYCERMSAKAAEYRALADKYDELARNSMPVPVTLPHGFLALAEGEWHCRCGCGLGVED